MSLRIAVGGVTHHGEGIWSGVVGPGDLDFLAGHPDSRGQRTIVLLLGDVTHTEDRLEFDRSGAFLLNVGGGHEALFLYGGRRAESDNDRPEPPVSDGRVYWVTVSREAQGNLDLALEKGVWGVPSHYAKRLDAVREGDYALFYGHDIGVGLCRVESAPFTALTRIWPDGNYPRRVRISKPLQRNAQVAFSDISGCLRDAEGRPYASGQAAGRGIGGPGGVFRRLNEREIACLFEKLGWKRLGPS